LIALVSLVIGSVLGEWWGIEAALERLGGRLEARVGSPPSAEGEPQRSLSRAFVMSSLVFCVGPIAIIGSIQDGLTGDHRLLIVKSALDLVASLAFGAALGPGVILAALSVLAYQGVIGFGAMGLASMLGHVTPESPAVVEMTATGGVLIMAIGLILLEIRQIRVGNMLPAVAVAPAIVALLGMFGVRW
jgi:uncharacterized protein